MKRGIVFCGGGSLGSYEIGAWKALRELGEDRFQIATGTSIGSIHAAMYACDQFDTALTMWKKIEVQNIIRDGMDIDFDLIKKFSLKKGAPFRTFFASYLRNHGVDNTPFEELLRKTVEPLPLAESPVKVGIVSTAFPSLREVNVVLNDVNPSERIDWLLASAACVPVFPVYKFGKRRFIDGGWVNNLPIDLALKMGAEEVVAIKLNCVPAPRHTELYKLPNVTLIAPSRSQGSEFVFARKAIDANMLMGYQDVMKVYGRLGGIAYAFEPKSMAKATKLFFAPIYKEMASAYLYLEAYSKRGLPPGRKLSPENVFAGVLEKALRRYDCPHPEKVRTVEEALQFLKGAIGKDKTPHGRSQARYYLRDFSQKEPVKLSFRDGKRIGMAYLIRLMKGYNLL